MDKDKHPIAPAGFFLNLQAERDELRAFITLLKTEQQALFGGQAEQLVALADSKTQAVQKINNLAEERRDNTFSRDAEIAPNSMDIWLGMHLPDGIPIWHEIRKLAAHAQQLNLVNGELIQAKLRHNQQALTILHNAARNSISLYGPDGQPDRQTPGRTLGSG